MTKSVIVRFHEFCIQENSAPLNRLSGFMLGNSMIDLIDEFLNDKYSSDEMELLESNPRNPKRSSITSDIIESLEQKKELFPLMSKGILISSQSCKKLERNRFEVSFNNPKIHGILDGGHNTLAIAMFILEKSGASVNELRKVKRWTDLKDVWNKYITEIQEIKKVIDFLLPTEILYPKTNNHSPVMPDDESDFVNSIMEIAQARNNNTQLTEETKANKKGFYEVLKKYVDENLREKIEWRTNDGGKIKVRELIALSLIPLSKTRFEKDINPVHIYSSKAECVRMFEKLVNTEGVSKPAKGDVLVEIIDEQFISAMAMIDQLPRLYDELYDKLPDAYNKSSDGKFGRISSVTMSEDNKPAGRTKYYGKSVSYSYPDGFVMPLVYSLKELMGLKNGQLYWVVDPFFFINNHLGDVMANYGESVIKMSGYDPQKVGKNRGSYNVACMAVRDVLNQKKLLPN